MSQVAQHPVGPTRRIVLRDLDERRDAVAYVTPNWFAAVMGTGIVGIAAASLPEQFTGLRTFGVIMWLLATTLLLVLGALTAAHWLRHRETARGHATHPVMGHFYGAVPMALMTVGTGALLLGRDVVGLPAALTADWILWSAGTVLGLATTVAVPYLMIARRAYEPGAAFGGWLMPVVPPMVSAAAGALLAPHLPVGAARNTMIVACYALFGVSLVASAVVIPAIARRLVSDGPGPARMVPTLWIVLGPLGQSITAAGLLGRVAPAPLAQIGFAYGVVVWCLAVAWAAVAATATLRAAREGLPFSLTWWSFTFPVGTCVTGTAALAAHSGLGFFAWAAVAFYAGLVLVWARVATRTLHGGLVSGYLLVPPTA